MQKRWNPGKGPRVRIHLPPAASPVRTLFRGSATSKEQPPRASVGPGGTISLHWVAGLSE